MTEATAVRQNDRTKNTDNKRIKIEQGITIDKLTIVCTGMCTFEIKYVYK